MLFQQNNAQAEPQGPVPQGGSSEYGTRYFRWLKKPLIFLIVFLIMHETVGVPAIRSQWTSHGKYGPTYASTVEVVSCFGEKRTYYRYKTLITFMEDPEITLWDFTVKTLKHLWEH